MGYLQRIPVAGMVVAVLLSIATVAEENKTSMSTFADGQWDAEQWCMVKSPRWPHIGAWVQRETCIENAVPADAAPEELLGKHVGETYTSMVLKETQPLPFTLTTTFLFTDRMAPLIVLASSLGKDANGYPEYREHMEFVFWDQGVNVWHHQYSDGQPSWKCLARYGIPLKANTKYTATLRIVEKHQGTELSLTIADHALSLWTDLLPDRLYTGITACEGVNRFYEFSVEAH